MVNEAAARLPEMQLCGGCMGCCMALPWRCWSEAAGRLWCGEGKGGAVWMVRMVGMVGMPLSD